MVGNALIDRVIVLIHLQSALSQMLFIYIAKLTLTAGIEALSTRIVTCRMEVLRARWQDNFVDHVVWNLNLSEDNTCALIIVSDISICSIER